MFPLAPIIVPAASCSAAVTAIIVSPGISHSAAATLNRSSEVYTKPSLVSRLVHWISE
ncbi:hypothetical protein KKH82_06130 [Patescibacteria group bacterium]|nr:hypothetical protein [Patescibacteria group bacterium]